MEIINEKETYALESIKSDKVVIICKALEGKTVNRYESLPFNIDELPLTKAQMIAKLTKKVDKNDIVMIKATSDFLVKEEGGKFKLNEQLVSMDELLFQPLES